MPDYVWIQNVVFPILGMGLGGVGMVLVYRVARQWIERKHEREMRDVAPAGSPEELDDLRARVTALEETAYRVQELEERLDFTERVLARERRERPALGEGH